MQSTQRASRQQGRNPTWTFSQPLPSVGPRTPECLRPSAERPPVARQAWAQLRAGGGLRGERWVKPLSAEHVAPTSLFRGVGQEPPESKSLGIWCPQTFENQRHGSRMQEGTVGGGVPQRTLTMRAEGEGEDSPLDLSARSPWAVGGLSGTPPHAVGQDGCEYVSTQSAGPPAAEAPGTSFTRQIQPRQILSTLKAADRGGLQQLHLS